MRPVLILLAILAMSTATTTLAAQSGWMRSPGDSFWQVSTSTFSSGEYYSVDGILFNQGSQFSSNALQLYSEYGLASRWTISGSWPILRTNRFASTQTVVSPGDIQLEIKYALSKRLPIAISLMPEIPTGDGILLASAKTPNSLGIREQINLPTTDGEFNLWSRLALSQSTPTGRTYGTVYAAVNWRTNGFSPQWRVGAELGRQWWNKLWLIGKLTIQERFNTDSNQRSVSFLYGEGTTFTTGELGAYYTLHQHWKILVSFRDFIAWPAPPRNVYTGSTWTIGVAREFLR